LESNSPKKFPEMSMRKGYAKAQLMGKQELGIIGMGQGIQTGSLVVANSEEGSDVATGILETTAAAAVIGSTSDLGSSLPDDLGEVTPTVESGLVVDVGWSSLAVQSVEVTSLVVVEQIGDDGGHVVSRAAGSNVLAVSTAIGVALQWSA
jgi:hypothetical protein